jgi:hypothetical protein
VKRAFIIYGIDVEHITPALSRHSFPGVMIFLIIENNKENSPEMMAQIVIYILHEEKLPRAWIISA